MPRWQEWCGGIFDLQGHRGARGLWPENTLAGFVRTRTLGVMTFELDCAVTRRGAPVQSDLGTGINGANRVRTRVVFNKRRMARRTRPKRG